MRRRKPTPRFVDDAVHVLAEVVPLLRDVGGGADDMLASLGITAQSLIEVRSEPGQIGQEVIFGS